MELENSARKLTGMSIRPLQAAQRLDEEQRMAYVNLHEAGGENIARFLEISIDRLFEQDLMTVPVLKQKKEELQFAVDQKIKKLKLACKKAQELLDDKIEKYDMF